MSLIEILTISLRTMTFAIALFGALLLLGDELQRRFGWGLALFMGVVAIDSFAETVWLWGYSEVVWVRGLELLATFAYGPAIYLYVLAITGREPSAGRILLCVGAPQCLALSLLVVFLTLPRQILIDILIAAPISDHGQAYLANVITNTTQLTFVILTSGFILGCWLALDENLRRIDRLFSSIEDRTLAWLRGVMILVVLAWGWAALQGILEQLLPRDVQLGVVDAVITVSWVSLLAYFGIQQRPALLAADVALLSSPRNKVAGKYARSALDHERMIKLGDRMNLLMSRHSLHRDPALSLRGLSDRVGASPNHVSQTLNEHLGVSFFDFVNSFRVAEAELLLSETNRSVSDIALEVGFNSRSTFNAAVRKHRGRSPTEMRRS